MSTAIEFAINSIKASDEDEAALKKYQERATLINPNMRNAYMAGGMTDGFENNDNSAGTGFMGMGFAQMGMGMMQGMNVPQQNYQQAPQHNTFGTTTQSQAGGNSWKCNCGHVNTGNFCMECGSKKPLPSSANGWTCSCGTVNQGKFCMNLRNQRPLHYTVVTNVAGDRQTQQSHLSSAQNAIIILWQRNAVTAVILL